MSSSKQLTYWFKCLQNIVHFQLHITDSCEIKGDIILYLVLLGLACCLPILKAYKCLTTVIHFTLPQSNNLQKGDSIIPIVLMLYNSIPCFLT